jgi:PIN domain nuclease of toxin-antitoxin system
MVKRLLLDTNALLWFAYHPARLTSRGLQAFREADELRFSIVNLWEIGLKLSSGGFRDLAIPPDWHTELAESLVENGIVELPVLPRHCRRVQDLPFHHRDPFDRMLIAQALEEGLEVIGSDGQFDAYGVRRVW